MDSWFIPIRLIISFLLGAVIGLEREINEKKVSKVGQKPQAILGLRSFSIITSLGTILGFIYQTQPWLSLVLTAGVLVLFIMFYAIDTSISKDTGITTELAMVYSFIIGILLAFNVFSMQIILALTVVFILILSRKRKIKSVVEDIRKSELDALIAFAIISLVILPFLPNESYSLADFPGLMDFFSTAGLQVEKISQIELVNPFSLWLIVVLITGIDLAGYILERTIGRKKGWFLASIVGGFVSSTATTQSLAQQSKSSKAVNHLIAAALIANFASFIQITILLSPINPPFIVTLFPTVLLLIFSTLVICYYFLRKKEGKLGNLKESNKDSQKQGIFEFSSAIKFALLYIAISLVSDIALEFFGSGAFLFTTAVGALAGLDAVMINTAQLAGSKIDFTLAALGFIIANAVNLTGKVVYSFLQGKKEFSRKFAISIAIIIFSSLIGLFFI